MSVEDRLRVSLRTRAARAEASPDAYDRIVERAEGRHRPWLVPAVALGGAAAVVALALASVGGDAGRDTGRDEVVAGSDPEAPAASAPIWPVTDFEALTAMQRRVDSGERAWLLEPRDTVRKYLGEHDVVARDLAVRPGDVGRELEVYPEAVAVGYREGRVDLARTAADEGAVWFVVAAHDGRIPVVEAVRDGARLDVELSRVTEDVVVVARAGSSERTWLAEATAELRQGRPQRMTLDVGADAPSPLLLQLRTTGAGDLVGLTERWVDDPP